MLDEGRHFHGKETVLRTLDLMALQKLNVFHWHLTEDEGWRIEIKKYPKLTGIGAWRAGTGASLTRGAHNGVPYGGFYTQAEIREIVAYASERHITIVPEVEMPGHALAALAAYPELSCTGGPFEVGTHFGIYPDIFCAGKEATFSFLKDVLDEVLELFPSPTIHIGGDEAPKKRWKACPDCQRRIQDEQLKDEHALQVYFTNRIMAYLDSKGRHAMGWNEILQPGLAKSAIVQFWVRGRKNLLQALRNDQRAIVMSTFLETYLDHAYSLMPLSRAYRYEPVPKELEEKDSASILGLEFPLWTEWVPERLRMDYQVYPRLTAMAETAWTPKEHKGLADFRCRLPGFLARLDRLGVQYASMDDAEPGRIKQLFGIFSIMRPQTKIAG
jgi:hexosaminidase